MRITLDTMTNAHNQSPPRGIAVVDVGFTNTKVILYDAKLNVLGERKITSPHHDGKHYREIDVGAILQFAVKAIHELDAITPIDAIVPSAHGACIVCLKSNGALALPVMDYLSEPPPDILESYKKLMPDFAESYTPLLPMALMHAVQLFWQQTILPEAFAQTTIILPLMQYIAFGLGGRAVTEVSSMSCQSHLVDMRSGKPSSTSVAQGWDKHFAPEAKAWDVVGTFPSRLNGRGQILAGVHDSNANYLRYLAAGQKHFTLLSTGTWIISFDTDADMMQLDHARDIVANKDVFGRTVACSRFFGGKEFEIIAKGADGSEATLGAAAELVRAGIMALPSFTDSGGPIPDSGGQGKIIGPLPDTGEARASLASLYCALMMSESLDALHSKHAIIVDGPFSQNEVFLKLLASLRSGQSIYASHLRDGTATGAACLALMPDGLLTQADINMRDIAASNIDLANYQRDWKTRSISHD
jgi:sugar (pentulose or hexulose) kinase